jgi:protein SCO1/2
LSQAILYENDRTWQTDKAAPMKLSEFKGRPVLMAMFFTTCSGTCGVTVNHLMQIRASLSAQEREQIDVVLVSFDSDNDTPAALARYRAERHLPAEWTLLRGPAECTRELADQLGVSYAPDSARHILHGTQIALLDANGHIVHRAVGTNADMDVVIGAIRAALAGTALPPLEAAVQPLKFAAEKKSCCNTN